MKYADQRRQLALCDSFEFKIVKPTPQEYYEKIVGHLFSNSLLRSLSLSGPR